MIVFKQYEAGFITDPNPPEDIAVPGTTVTLSDLATNDEPFEINLVGAEDAKSIANRVSYLSPIGKAVFEHRSGEIVEAMINGSARKYQILSIEKTTKYRKKKKQ